MADKRLKETKDKIICLRPHHLLCTQGYSGKGYSDEFVKEMSAVTDKLRKDPDIKVRIVFDTDRLCGKCPAKLGEGVCKDDKKVLRYDQKVKEILNLTEGVVSYREMTQKIDDYIIQGSGDERLKGICGDCAWYDKSACSKNILTKKYIL